LSAEPRLILADEPTTALDVTIQAQVLNVIDKLRREQRLGVILVSHDLAVVSQTCSRVYVMYAGRVVEEAPVDQLLTLPRHPYTFALLRSVPDPDAPVHRLLTIPGQPPDLTETPVGCSFAPRCAFAKPECREDEPPLRATPGEPDHAAACIRSDTAPRWPEWSRAQPPVLMEKIP
jgi:oligopeptide/dipeptide ABC transporter ATP-binding protein